MVTKIMQLRNCPDLTRVRIQSARVTLKFNCRVESPLLLYITTPLNILVLNFNDKFLVKTNSSVKLSHQSLKFIHWEKILNLVNSSNSNSGYDTRVHFRRTLVASYAVIISPVTMNDNLELRLRWHVTRACYDYIYHLA